MMPSNYNGRAKLALSEPQAVYYAGQEIGGHIELEIQNPIQFSAINVTFHGQAHVNWSEVDYEEYNGVQRSREVVYNGVQECLHYTQCLYGTVLPGRGEGVIDISSLPPGIREIPFRYTLPYNIPSSFKGEKGKVSYNVTALVEYLNEYMGKDELYLEFVVVAPTDLLADDIVRPLEMHFEEVYSCWCFSSPMSIDIKCPVSGYCPGQSIPINVKVHNESAVEVKKIVFQLVKKELYRSLAPPSEYTTPEEVLATIKTGAILSNSDKGFTCHLPVPPMIAPNLDNCEIIDIGFFLKATIKMTGFNDDLEDEALFFIGLKPIPGTPGAENYVHPLAYMLPNGAPIPDPLLRANVEQVVRPESNSYPPSYPGQIFSPYPAENTGSRPNSHGPVASQPMSSYPGQNVAPYPTGNSGPSGPAPYPPSNPTDDIAPPYPSQPNPSSLSTSPYPAQNPPYPTANSPYPTPPSQRMSSYPVQNVSPYPAENTGSRPNSHGPVASQPMSSYPGQNVAPYPTGNSGPSGPAPYPPSNPTDDIAPTYPSHPNPSSLSTSPYPAQNPPYPLANSPYPTPPSQPMSSYPVQNVSPYPAENPGSRPNSHGPVASQPLSTSPYPAQNPPYPTANSPYPTPPSQPMFSYPGQNVSPYPAENTGSRPNSHGSVASQPMSSYPGQNVAPYPTGNSGPSGPAPYPPSNPTDDIAPPYPSQPNPSSRSTSPYPTGNSGPSGPAPYPPSNPTDDIAPPYPSQPNPSSRSTSPYTTGNSGPSGPAPYPPSNATDDIAPPYPSQPNPSSRSTSPCLAQNPPYPTANSPYPTPNSPYPTSNSPYPKSESISMTPLRTQTIGFILPRGSPYPKAKPDDDRRSPFTPLMQYYPSPSAPPPST